MKISYIELHKKPDYLLQKCAVPSGDGYLFWYGLLVEHSSLYYNMASNKVWHKTHTDTYSPPSLLCWVGSVCVECVIMLMLTWVPRGDQGR